MKGSAHITNIYNGLPKNIKSLLIISDGWLVGGAVRDLIDGKKPLDFDIIVSPANHGKALLHMSRYKSELNTFGGLKYDMSGIEVDLWPDSIEQIFKTGCKYAYHINNRLLLVNEA